MPLYAGFLAFMRDVNLRVIREKP